MIDFERFLSLAEAVQRRRLAYLSNDVLRLPELKNLQNDLVWFREDGSLMYILRWEGLSELRVYLNKEDAVPIRIDYAADQPVVLNWVMRLKEKEKLLPVLENRFQGSGLKMRTQYVRMQLDRTKPLQCALIPEGFELTQRAEPEAVLRLWQDVIDPFSTPLPQMDEIQQMMENGNLYFLTWEGAPVACVCCEPQGKRVTLQHIATDPAYRRRGLAMALMLHTLNDLPADAAVQLWVDITNQHAISLYRKMNFSEDDRLSCQWIMFPPENATT